MIDALSWYTGLVAWVFDRFRAVVWTFVIKPALGRRAVLFALMVAGELPGGPVVETSVSLAGVFDWYQDCPEQIERVVIA